jgi:alcohol dehydrogenase class IV
MSAASAFEFATATRIVFGAGKLAELPSYLRELGLERVLLVVGRNLQRSAAVRDALSRANLTLHTLSVAGEPTVDSISEALATLRQSDCQGVVAFGGGSVIDAGKALAALAANSGDPLDYLEVIGRGRTLTQPSLPCIAIPTTAGTGAEVTRNAVLSSRTERVKASLRSPTMLPRLALVDPDLLRAAPAEVLRSSGLDALSQLIEPFLSIRSNPLCDALAREGIRRSARSLRGAVLDADSARDSTDECRADLALASLLGGLCLANSGLGAVHGFAAPAGGMFHAPHGAVCAALLPHVLAVNLRALELREPAHPARARFDELGQLLTGAADAGAAQAVDWVRELCAALRVPGLAAYGMSERDVPALVSKAKAASSMRGNPLALNDAELAQIASAALGDS